MRKCVFNQFNKLKRRILKRDVRLFGECDDTFA